MGPLRTIECMAYKIPMKASNHSAYTTNSKKNFAKDSTDWAQQGMITNVWRFYNHD